MKLFKNDLASRLIEQLEDLFPQDCIEARFSAFDLNLIQFNPNDESQKRKEIDLIESVCEKSFTARTVTNSKGAEVTFVPLPGDVKKACQEWQRVRLRVTFKRQNFLYVCL